MENKNKKENKVEDFKIKFYPINIANALESICMGTINAKEWNQEELIDAIYGILLYAEEGSNNFLKNKFRTLYKVLEQITENNARGLYDDYKWKILNELKYDV